MPAKLSQIISTIKIVKGARIAHKGNILSLQLSDGQVHRLTTGTPLELVNFLWGLRFGLDNPQLKER